jgi:hypothetical protein
MHETASRQRAAGFDPGNILQFAVKACIVAVVISVSTIVVASWVIGSIEASAARSLAALRETAIGGPQFWGKVERELARAADPRSDLPPEKKQKLLNDLRTITVRWRPFVDAVTTELQRPAQ